MNPWALFPLSAFFVVFFAWVYVFAQQNKDPINTTFLIFAADAAGWIAVDLFLYHPYSIGHEMLCYQLVSIFWIPCGSLFLLFAYALIGRKRDKLLLLSFAVSAIGIAINVFTDAIVIGTIHQFWGTSQISHPIYHPLLSLGTAGSAAYAVFLISRKRRYSIDPLEKRSLSLLIWGAVIVMTVIATTNVAIPAIFTGSAFPKFGSSAFTLFILLVFLAVKRYRFLSISVEKVAEELFEDLKDGILLTDRSGRVQRCNAAAREMLYGHLVGSDVWYLFSEQDIRDDFTDLEVTRGPETCPRHISVSASTTIRNGDILGRIFILKDTTKQKNAEAVLRRSKEELEKEVRERTEQLRHAQRMEALGTLAGGIAHDFNNILAAILGFTVAAKNDVPQNSRVLNDLNEIIIAGNRGREIVRQILAISRKDNAGEMAPKDLAKILKETIDLVKVSCPPTITLSTDIPKGPFPVLCDETQITQVIMNLTTNAIHAMKNTLPGELHVGLEETHVTPPECENIRVPMGLTVRLWITDTGNGISKAHLGQIFNPFFTTKPQGEGTGLGLSTSLVIVQNHKGDITVESEEGIGTTFSIYLPMLDRKETQIPDASPRDSGITPLSYRGQELILLVDDEPQIRRMGERVLKQLGYTVQTADDGMDALTMLLETQIQYDLLITDLSMPRMTGLELAFELRNAGMQIPVILMSGYGEKASVEDISAAEISAFLQKPAKKNELGATIRAILDHDYFQTGFEFAMEKPDNISSLGIEK